MQKDYKSYIKRVVDIKLKTPEIIQMYREAEKAMQEELKNKIFDMEEEVATTSEQERIAEDEADEVIAANYDEYMAHKRRDD